MRPAIVVGVSAAVAIAVALGLRYGTRRLDGVVAATVERYGSAVTGTDVDVGGVALALSAGRADLAGITIANPSGYDTDFAVRVGHATVELDIASLAGNVPIIEELLLDGATINAEQRSAASNLTDIQRHVTGTPDDAAGEPGRIVVERFRLSNARVVLTSEYLSEPEELVLRDVVIDGIGEGTGGVTYAQAAEAMLAPVLSEARAAAAERFRTVAADAVREEVDDQLRDEADELEDQVRERIDELL
jgi:hypothetical protein